MNKQFDKVLSDSFLQNVLARTAMYRNMILDRAASYKWVVLSVLKSSQFVTTLTKETVQLGHVHVNRYLQPTSISISFSSEHDIFTSSFPKWSLPGNQLAVGSSSGSTNYSSVCDSPLCSVWWGATCCQPQTSLVWPCPMSHSCIMRWRWSVLSQPQTDVRSWPLEFQTTKWEE